MIKLIDILNEGISEHNIIHKLSIIILNRFWKQGIEKICEFILEDDTQNMGSEFQIFLPDIEIDPINKILYNYSQMELIDDKLSEWLYYTNLHVIFTNNLKNEEYGKLIVDYNSEYIYINYNKNSINQNMFNQLNEYNFNITMNDCKILVKHMYKSHYLNSIIHELQHSYDIFRSNNKIDIGYNVKNEYGTDYLNLPSEMWARFSEVLSSLKSPKKIDQTQIINILKSNFEGFDELSEQNKRRLYGALYKFLTKKNSYK